MWLAERDVGDRVLFCVDGVHGLGIEDVTMGELGCDFFIAGTHKWLYGPRGTGLIWGCEQAWDALEPIIPTFGPTVGVWNGALPSDTPLVTPGSYHTPGGFHSFEQRWALGEAFRFHEAIGKSRLQERVHSLNSLAKQALGGRRCGAGVNRRSGRPDRNQTVIDVNNVKFSRASGLRRRPRGFSAPWRSRRRRCWSSALGARPRLPAFISELEPR